MKKTVVLIIFGGVSPEHEVSVISADAISRNIDRDRYIPLFVGIGKDGKWYYFDNDDFNKVFINGLIDGKIGKKVIPKISEKGLDFEGLIPQKTIDIVFPMIHGKTGEDGSLQGFLEICNMKYIGSGVRASAICMDKINCKNILEKNNIKVTPYIEMINKDECFSFEKIKKELGIPFFIKPSNGGSSLGVSKVNTEIEYNKALKKAFNFDERILCEKAIYGKELECAVLGDKDIKVSIVGEVLSNSDFYSYKVKYIDKDKAKLKIPADIPSEISTRIQNISKRSHSLIGCSFLSRVDFFLSSEDELFLNEINTIPGFTPISMYPLLFEKSGFTIKELITDLIEASF